MVVSPAGAASVGPHGSLCPGDDLLTRVVVVPRWGGTPADDWYPWAAAELGADGVSLEALALPDPAQPEIDAWIAGVAAGLAEGAAAETILVGHSVGCRAALRAVERLPDGVRLPGLLLVAAWWDVDDPWPSILPWQALGHDGARVAVAVGRPLVLLSDDDPFTSDWRTNRDRWVERFDADVRVQSGAKHFNGAREPAVLAAIRELCRGGGEWGAAHGERRARAGVDRHP